MNVLLLAAVTVFRGVTLIEEPIVLTPADSGREFVGEEGAVISGGIRLTDWKDVGGGVWEAEAPRNRDGSVMFLDQLWVDGRRAPNAVFPKKWYTTMHTFSQKVVTNAVGKIDTTETMVFTNQVRELLAQVPPADLKYIQLGVIEKWSYARVPLATFDAKTGTVTTHLDDRINVGWKTWAPDTVELPSLVRLTNLRSAFTEPGEWFVDMSAATVRYRPRVGEDMAAVKIMVPRYGMSQLVIFRGDPEHGKFVEKVKFRNISFENSAFTVSDANGGAQRIVQHQSACSSDGAIELLGARNCEFENCRVAHTGNYGMRIGNGSWSNRVVNCTFEDLGAGGVWMGESYNNMPFIKRKLERRIIMPQEASTSVAYNLISNCTVRAGGRYNPEGTGIAITHASDTKIVHNDIYDILYSGVCVGYTWGYKGSVSQRNEIGYNHIYDLGKGVMSDMSAIYMLATSFGSWVHDNVLHDIDSYRYGGFTLYCDEGSEGIIMERNLCWNSRDGGFYQHYGVGNIIRNNIFAWNREHGAVRVSWRTVRDGVPTTFHFCNNIVLTKGTPLVSQYAQEVGGVWMNNLWYDVDGEASARYFKQTWQEWLASGREVGGAFADPRFVDAEHYDFRLRTDSPAWSLGFKAWDFSAAGRK